jgi:predicted RND superfamily exporter protein
MQTLAYLGGQDKVYKRAVEIAGVEGEETIFTRIYDLVAEQAEGILPGARAFQEQYAPYFRNSVLSMTNTETLTLENLPATIVDRYANRSRNMFLVTTLPTENIWTDVSFLDEFTTDMETVSERSTGMPPVFKALIEYVGRDGRRAAILTLIVVFVLLTLDFRNPGYALMAMIPLAAGVFWMVGFMALIGSMLTVVNVMSIPLILGIGIDDGVHIVHRWRREGHGSARIIYAHTGKAILLTSLTTMIAFFSMVFSLYRGYASLGYALVIGVGACFLTSVILLPGIIGLIERLKK